MANKKEFKPHMMYIKDKQKADTYKEHLELEEKGYDHTPFNILFKKKRKKNPCWKGYKMIGVGHLVAQEILGKESELLKPFRFNRYEKGELHPTSNSPFPWS